jgi:hypothetical protein
MGRGFNIPWVGAQNTIDRESDISWVGEGGHNSMVKGSHISCIQGAIFHAYSVRYTMDRGRNIPWVGG